MEKNKKMKERVKNGLIIGGAFFAAGIVSYYGYKYFIRKPINIKKTNNTIVPNVISINSNAANNITKDITVQGINYDLQICSISTHGTNYSAPIKVENGKLFFKFKNIWHELAAYASDSLLKSNFAGVGEKWDLNIDRESKIYVREPSLWDYRRLFKDNDPKNYKS